ncbi:AEC family transporter [Ideonella azotifigens]|uniref:AEC family transporter n=1 Tax=Ideonella azotifigens TaxID=513160 RepID=A0ABN1JLA7_9BURK|nr:AEC family transporter [Ideonella azotifigens]MCD2339695.1 AEC family transporter [Ideonella azotifigens]
MTLAILYKLLAIVLVVALGWIVGRLRWLGEGTADNDPARILSAAAFYLFAPALFFRTTARVDLAHLPWAMLAAFFVPVTGLMLAVYGVQRARRDRSDQAVAAPAVRAVTVTFGNSVQIGIPLAAGVLGEAGLGLHLTLVSVHALILLLVCTTLVELDLARAHAAPDAHLGHVLLGTLRNAVIHPVVLPVLAGLAWNLIGWPLPEAVDEVLRMLGSAVVPLCLTLIGMSLAYLGLPKRLDGAIAVSALKLGLQPALVLGVAHWGFGLTGTPLAVLVLLAALPAGSNSMMFAQRYRTLEAETTAVNVLSTLAFVGTAPLWLALLAWLG